MKHAVIDEMYQVQKKEKKHVVMDERRISTYSKKEGSLNTL